VAEVWTQAAQPWLRLSNDLVSSAREADDIPAIMARWESRQRQALSAGARNAQDRGTPCG
jgi:hypothetical protein